MRKLKRCKVLLIVMSCFAITRLSMGMSKKIFAKAEEYVFTLEYNENT